MLVTSQLPIQITKFFYSFLTCACASHFEKGSATHAWGVVFTSDGRRSEEIYCIHGLAKLTQFCVSLSFCGHKTGAFTHRKAVSFQNGICSGLYLRS